MNKRNATLPVPADNPSKQYLSTDRVGGSSSEGRKSIAWIITKIVEDSEATQFSGVVRWRDNIESTQLRGFARWRGNKYSC
jgi:hypothetical protein